MKPILFKTEMVNAILNGHKTMTRRLMNPQPILCTGQKLKKNQGLPAHFNVFSRIKTKDITDHIIPKPFQIGEILWVKETFAKLDITGDGYSYVYKASENGKDWSENSEGWKWKPSLFMPMDAARIFLEVTNVLYEQVQEISEEDAVKEGFKSREDFKNLWIKINGEKSWNDNPYVFVYTFEIKEIKYNDYETLQSNP